MKRPDKSWLDSLKLGDKVALFNNGYECGYSILTVERRTPTLIVFVGGLNKARASDGKVIGESFRYIEPVTDEIVAKNNAEKAKAWARRDVSYDLAKLSVEQVLQVREMVKSMLAAAPVGKGVGT